MHLPCGTFQSVWCDLGGGHHGQRKFLEAKRSSFIILLECSWFWNRKWQPTPVFLPGNSHGQRSLASYSPWGHKRVGHDLVTKQQTATGTEYMWDNHFQPGYKRDSKDKSYGSSLHFCRSRCHPKVSSGHSRQLLNWKTWRVDWHLK